MDSSIENSADDEFLRKPLWKYVTRLGTGTEAGGNISWKCNFCSKDFKSSYTRIRAHLLKLSGKGIAKCLHVQTKDLLEMEKSEQEASERLKNNASKNVPLPPSDIVGDVSVIKHFIMSYSMRLSMFNEFVGLKLLSIAETRFASMIVMLKRFKLIKGGLQNMVISEKWSVYKDDNLGRAKFVKEKILEDLWWDSIDYILAFTAPIYNMIRICDTDKPCLHLIYDMWDEMIEKVKKAIYLHELKRMDETSTFYDVVHGILVDRWAKNSTPLHCLAHALNPKYYSQQWLDEDSNRVPPHKDQEINQERQKCLKRYFPNLEDRNKINLEYVDFASASGGFRDYDVIQNRYSMDPKAWWVLHGACAPMLQKIALRLVAQPSSSSCAERNWSTYSFVHSVRRNKMTPKRAEDLVYIHSNLRLLSRKSSQYTQGESKMWDIAGDTFDTFEDVGMLEVATLSLDEPEMESNVIDENVPQQ